MNNCLIILTSSYPFLSGEPFLECEIGYHIKNFSKIIILAFDVDSCVKPARDIPKGVEVYNISKQSKNAGRLRDLLKGVLHSIKSNEVYLSDKTAIGHSISKRVFMEYFEARAQRQFYESAALLDNFDFSQFDNLVFYSYWLFVTARAGVLLRDRFARRYGKGTLISRAHGYDIYDYRNRLRFLPLRPLLLGNIDKVFTCSDDGCDFLRKKYPKYKDRIISSFLGTIDRGIGTAPADCFHIVSCSRIVPVKRVGRILSGLALLNNYGKKLKWTHIGGGGDLEKLQKSASEVLGFMEVNFTGAMPNKEVYDFYVNNPVSLFINVSSSEGLPVSIMEAASFGIPAIATEVGGTGEIVLDCLTGRLLNDKFRDEDLSQLIQFFSNLPENEYYEYRNRARANWEDKFNAEKNYSSFSMTITH